MLRWFEHFKPVWDFLTAFGTVGLAAVTVWLTTRPERQARREQIRRFKELRARMPDLFKAMAESLRSDATGWIREFVILSNPSITISDPSKPRFRYNESEYPNLRDRIDMLRDAGYLDDPTIGSTLICKMREHFVRLLKERA